MTGDQAIEEMPQAGQVLFGSRNTGSFSEPVEVLTDVLRRDGDQLQIFRLRPQQKLFNGVQVGGAGVLVADAAVEKFVRGEDGGLTAANQNFRQLAADRRNGFFTRRNELGRWVCVTFNIIWHSVVNIIWHTFGLPRRQDAVARTCRYPLT